MFISPIKLTVIINAAIDIVQELGANVIAVGCVMDLPFLSGSSKIRNRGIPVHSGVEYNA